MDLSENTYFMWAAIIFIGVGMGALMGSILYDFGVARRGRLLVSLSILTFFLSIGWEYR